MHRAALERLVTIITVSVKTATNLALTYHNFMLISLRGFSETLAYRRDTSSSTV